MRLINTTTIQLHEVSDDEVPYVILSHRWESAEVTFQDMMTGKASDKEGYAKIVGCCEQARKDGFDFVWIDTCCIDKSSSTELSEAINSMFQYYGNAQMCYAYLSDVSSSEGLARCEEPDSGFRKSKWFTRGWTLQELLVPEIVVFYNHDWVEIGTKSSMESLISNITNISAPFLRGVQSFMDASVAQKMSWASRRTTTRVEDIAYCLMGIHNVHMPLLYGEGVNAFYRLQLEVIKTSSDESIFVWGRMREAGHSLNGIGKIPTRTSGILAESPAMFENSGTIVSELSGRPPYTMTNRGLQIDVHLEEIGDRQATGSSIWSKRETFHHALHLFCKQEHTASHVAIVLRRGLVENEWVRDTDLFFTLSFGAKREFKYREARYISVEQKNTWNQIFIRCPRPGHPLTRTEALDILLLDIRSLIKDGYDVRAYLNSCPIDLQYNEQPGMALLSIPNDNLYLRSAYFQLRFDCLHTDYTGCNFIIEHREVAQDEGFQWSQCFIEAVNYVELPRNSKEKLVIATRPTPGFNMRRRLEQGRLVDVVEIVMDSERKNEYS